MFLVVSCKTVAVSQNMQGEFHKKGKDYHFNLVLKKDNTFSLTQKSYEANSECDGKWQHFSGDTLLLKCNDVEDVLARLQSGYIIEREKKVIVLSKNRLMIGNVTLKRK
jgi:hypothetical protein